jgi:hypothetical protein
MAVEVLDGGVVEIRTTVRLVPGRDDDLIQIFVPVEPLNVAGTIRETMRGGVVKFERANTDEEEEVSLDIGIEI